VIDRALAASRTAGEAEGLVRLGRLAGAVFRALRAEAFDLELCGAHPFLDKLFHAVIAGGRCELVRPQPDRCSVVESAAARGLNPQKKDDAGFYSCQPMQND